MSIRDDIFASEDIKTERVETPEWKCGHINVRTASAKAQAEFYKGNVKNDVIANAAICAFASLDDEGNRIFSDEDAETLATKKSAAVVNRIAMAWIKLNGLGTAEVREAEKNS